MVYTLLLCCGLIIALVMLPFGKNVFAQSYGSKRQDEYFCNTEDDFVLKDILDGQSVGYNQEQDYQSLLVQAGGVQLRSVQSTNSCNAHSINCGQGREIGFSSTFLSTGCRSWEGFSYGNYGDTNIPFWLNLETFNTITNITHRNTLINDIREQAAMWNLAVMHDGTRQIVNLYEVGVGDSSLPADINGK